MKKNPEQHAKRVSARYLAHVEQLVRSATRYTEVYFETPPLQRGSVTLALGERQRALPQ